jgi:polyisoprenoid-binding protein YceI
MSQVSLKKRAIEDFMKKVTIIGLLLGLSGVFASAQSPSNPVHKLTIEVPESRIEFYVGSSAGDVNGVFKSWKCKFDMSRGNPERATLSLAISARSMTTGSRVKDNIIKGTKFFYVQKFPTVSFTSTKVITSTDPRSFQLQGDLTLRGVTKPATLQVNLDRYSKGNGQIYADLSFDRRDFGMTHNVPFVRVRDSVRVRMDLYVLQQPATSVAKP